MILANQRHLNANLPYVTYGILHILIITLVSNHDHKLDRNNLVFFVKIYKQKLFVQIASMPLIIEFFRSKFNTWFRHGIVFKNCNYRIRFIFRINVAVWNLLKMPFSKKMLLSSEKLSSWILSSGNFLNQKVCLIPIQYRFHYFLYISDICYAFPCGGRFVWSWSTSADTNVNLFYHSVATL